MDFVNICNENNFDIMYGVINIDPTMSLTQESL